MDDCAVNMNISSRYGQIWRINPHAGQLGYKQIPVRIAQEFANSQVNNVKINSIQEILLSYFYADNISEIDPLTRARAGLCLRCYISKVILNACKKIDFIFSGEQFTYRDLLPFVLNDDGQKLIILDRDGKTQLMVDDNCQVKELSYKFFSVTVLQRFNPSLQSRMSLDNWAYLQTKQNPELNKFLSELGFRHLSDWALLNRTRKKQIEVLSQHESYIVEAWNAVYRRDRQQQHTKGVKRCASPTDAQLQEMLVYLQKRQVWINTPVQLMKELKQIVVQLRKYNVWSARESLDIYDQRSGTYVQRPDLPSSSLDETDIEEQEFLQFLDKNLNATLIQTIKQQVEANIQKLQISRKYARFAPKYIEGLKLYYIEAMPLRDIYPELGMTSWDQARRILNPGELLSKVRAKTVEQMLDNILKLAAEKGLTQIPPTAIYLKTLSEQIENYLDGEIFQEAAEEIRAGKNRNMNSAYAKQICCYIQECT